MATVLWFRRDLRLGDNPALTTAADTSHAEGDGRVVPLFVVDPRLWEPAGPVRRASLVAALDALSSSLGGRLVIRYGDPAVMVPEVAAASEATSVHVAADFGPYGAARDASVGAALSAAGRTLVATGSPYAVAPGRVVKDDGTPYRVFTPFLKAWVRHGWRRPAAGPAAAPEWWQAVESLAPPAAPDLGSLILPEISEAAALARWDAFRADGLHSYRERRNRPDVAGTSGLSMDLKWGLLHPRTVLADLDDSAEHDAFRRQLAWREFYADVLARVPSSARSALAPRFDAMHTDSGPDADARLLAWQQGRTGYPFVDAGMRQLLGEGWMHNRVRMVVASFLVKDLHLPWQAGAAWFMRWLRDGDLANNSHGWQWTAGCGTDASPYYRVFNPVGQGIRFDPDGDYVRRWVPELRALPGAAVHEPWLARAPHPADPALPFPLAPALLLDSADPADPVPDYPHRIVDHATERLEALARLAALPDQLTA